MAAATIEFDIQLAPFLVPVINELSRLAASPALPEDIRAEIAAFSAAPNEYLNVMVSGRELKIVVMASSRLENLLTRARVAYGTSSNKGPATT